MITAIFNPGDKSITTKKVMQWDYGQVLIIKGLDLPKAVEIHFCVYTDSTTIPAVGITTDDHTYVEIPDGLLRQERELRAYVYVADLEQGKTVRTVNIPIQRRQKPEIPHTPEDTEIFREAIKAVNNSADRAETAANASEQNAKKTAEDRKTIEEMVETVSGIEQQVQDVKKYAGQAETAASNAALSEQKAKESETAALQAKTDAETAKGSAETAAGKTASDRTAVERAKEEVLQAKQQVSTDRAAVEAVERKVAQMGNAIPQAVLEGVQAVGSAGAAEKHGIVQAGTEQKSAVESAGTKTIEDINLAKKSATDAVETAKTGAVGAVGTAGTEQTQNVTAEGEKQVKALADKGAEVLQSIPEDFVMQMESKLDKQQGIENAGKAMVINPEGLIVPGEVTGGDGIPIINTASGGSPLVVSDSAERPVKGLGLTGKTEQDSTTGANLFDQNLLLDFNSENYDKTQSSSGFYFYKFKVDGTVTASTAKLNKNVGHLTVGIKPDGSDKTFLAHTSISLATHKTLTPEDGNIYLGVNTNLENVKNMLKNTGGIMINHGSVAMSYEPYTGGKPSPSPEYPQEIKNVGKWNEEKRKYEVDVRVTGKNLFDVEKAKNISMWETSINGYSQFKIQVKKGAKITVSYTEILATGMGFHLGVKTLATNSVEKWLYSHSNNSRINNSCTVIAQEDFLYLMCDSAGIAKFLDSINTLQIEISDTPTPYEPYKEQTITLTSDRPITKWDKLVEKDGEIGWLYGSKRYKVTGNESFESRGGYNGDSYTNRFFMLNDMQTDKTYSKPIAYVETLNHVLYCYAPDINKEGFDTNIKQFHIKISNDRVGILISDDHAVRTAKFSEYMKKIHKNGNPIEILYATTDMVFLPLAKSEQDAIRALKTYYTTTAITVDGGEVVPTVELTYTADTKNFILNREKVMQAQMLNIQSALISQKISGGGIKVTDSSSLPIEEFSMSGKTVQNGTPTPTNPVDIEVTPQGIITVDFTDGTNHQTIELNCPREFTKWDRLEKIDGVWNWVFGSRRYIITGNEEFVEAGAIYTTGSSTNFFTNVLSNVEREPNGYMERLRSVKGVWSKINEVGFSLNGVQLHMRLPNTLLGVSDAATKEEKKTAYVNYLKAEYEKGNPYNLLHEIKNPEYIPLSQFEQDKLNALTMYAPNTEITNTGGCNMEFTYTVDTKSYVDSKILTLSKALL